MSEYDFTPVVLLILTLIWAMWGLRQFRSYHQVDKRPRTDQRIPEEEMKLLGTECFDRVRPYFTRRIEAIERKHAAIAAVTGIDYREAEDADS